MEENIILAFMFTVVAGLATGIGGIIGLFAKKTNERVLSLALGFSAGVMLYVSFVDIYKEAFEMLSLELGEGKSGWYTMLGFFMGFIIIQIIDLLIPKDRNPHEIIRVEDMGDISIKDNNISVNDKHLLRIGVITATAITIHNFPEGIATFISTMADPKLGLPITFAIMLHNIPEGLAVSIPIFFATGSKRRAFKYSMLSGLAEPLGAIIGYLLIRPFLTNTVMGMIFASVAGIMVFISLDELLPSAKKYGREHTAMVGLLMGMIIMAISIQIM